METLLAFAELVAAGARLEREFMARVDGYAERHGMTRRQVLDELTSYARRTGRTAAQRVLSRARELAGSRALWDLAIIPFVGGPGVILASAAVRAVRRRRAGVSREESPKL